MRSFVLFRFYWLQSSSFFQPFNCATRRYGLLIGRKGFRLLFRSRWRVLLCCEEVSSLGLIVSIWWWQIVCKLGFTPESWCSVMREEDGVWLNIKIRCFGVHFRPFANLICKSFHFCQHFERVNNSSSLVLRLLGCHVWKGFMQICRQLVRLLVNSIESQQFILDFGIINISCWRGKCVYQGGICKKRVTLLPEFKGANEETNRKLKSFEKLQDKITRKCVH